MLGLGKSSLNLVYFCFFHDAWKDCNVPRFRFFGLVIHLRERKRNVDWPDSRLKQDRLQTAERGTPEFAREPLSFAVLHDLTTKPWRNASHGFQPIHHQKPTNVSTAIICNNRPSIFWWFVAAIYGKKKMDGASYCFPLKAAHHGAMALSSLSEGPVTCSSCSAAGRFGLVMNQGLDLLPLRNSSLHCGWTKGFHFIIRYGYPFRMIWWLMTHYDFA